MIRTSSARRRARTAVGALLAAAALTACGTGPAHQGSAVVVGGQRISISTVEGRVAAVRTAVAAQSGGAHSEPAALTKQTVEELVLDQVVARALADRQLSVSDEEITQVRDAQSKLLGGESELRSRLLLNPGIPAGEIDAFYRQQLGIRKIAAAQGKDARTPEGDAVVRTALADAGSKLKIEVNPRYGRWDPERITLTDAVADWLPQPAAAA